MKTITDFLRKILPCFVLALSSISYGQNKADSLIALFNKQLMRLPQEKIYLHTDKSYYMSGEKIWFRAHLLDAVSHIPSPASRYVYVELINPLDSVVIRIKVRHEDSAYYGHLNIPENAAEGDYILRAYTTFMRNLDENYFCNKGVRIVDPLSAEINVDAKFSFESDSEKKITAELKFLNPEQNAPFVPQNLTASINGAKKMKVKCDDSGEASVTFNLPNTSTKRVMRLEASNGTNIYRKFIQIPLPDKDFDLSFYPEGGQLLQGVVCNIAFKAMKSNGESANVEGKLYDNSDTEICEMKSAHCGMGVFVLIPAKGKSYYAIYKNDKGASKRFDLPAALENGYAVNANFNKDRLLISVNKAAGASLQRELYLLAHIRGIVYYADVWDLSKDFLAIPKNLFPSGVLQLLLLDAELNPLSERLVFLNNEDQAQVEYSPDKENYASRSPVKNTVKLTGNEDVPLTGSFSVSVTDDAKVVSAKTANILTNLLLTSDLRGYIENPSFYFEDNDKSATSLNMLMLTQGWRRYEIENILSDKHYKFAFPLELGEEISGRVKSLLGKSAGKNLDVGIVSTNGHFDATKTDDDGRFSFNGYEIPDSTALVVSVMTKKALKRYELLIDEVSYPQKTVLYPEIIAISNNKLNIYAEDYEKQYGIRLPEVVVTADRIKKKPLMTSPMYSFADNTITEEDMNKFPSSDMFSLLSKLPGVMVSNRKVYIRGQEPMLLVDGVPNETSFLEVMNVHDVAQVDVLKSAGNTAIFGSRGGNGVISIFTKEGGSHTSNKILFDIKTLIPLGYQKPVEFYSPKYDTPELKADKSPDLRSTVYWNPNVRTDSTGMAAFEFYTADANTSYSVIIEGVADNGKIIRRESTILRRNDLEISE